MSRKRSFRLSTVVAILALLATSLVASAAPADRSVSSVMRIPEGTTVDGAYSTLLRTDNGITMRIRTSDLDPRAVHTVWWVIYNNPEFCATDPCGPADDFNPQTNASIFYAAGTITGGNGKANFAAHVGFGYPGPVDGVRVIDVDGPGLLNPRTAEVHLVIRTHGPPIPGIVGGMLHSFDVGCPNSPVDPGPNTCANVQFAIHQAQ